MSMQIVNRPRLAHVAGRGRLSLLVQCSIIRLSWLYVCLSDA